VDLEVPPLSGEAYWGAITDSLKVPFYQPAAVVLDAGAKCDRCEDAVQHGLKLVLPVRANGGAGTATVPPKDLSMYGALLGELLDAHAAAVAAVVIEGSAETEAAWGGTVDEYLALLAAGCATAHAKGVRCTDGGLASTTMIFLLADYQAASGSTAGALNVVQLAGDNPEVKAAFSTWPPATEDDLKAGLATQKARLDAAKKLLAGVRAAGVDYASFRWWERDQDTLDLALAFMRNQTGCNAVAITDMGQRTEDAIEAQHKADDAKELGASLVIWSSRAESGGALLVDEAGALTENGTALAALSSMASCND
jgi:hypothetical protein